MDVKQIRLKIYLLEDISANRIQEEVTAFIDRGFLKDVRLKELHEINTFKNYCYDMPYPIEQDLVYKKGKIYTITIRTIDNNLADYFNEVCVNNYTKSIKGLVSEIRVLPKKHLRTVYTITPLIIKTEQGYWRTSMNISEFEQRLKNNLLKKWNCLHEQKLDDDFELYTLIELTNEKPISMEYKNIKLLGDKVRLHIADNKVAQNLAYMALGTGLGEMNSRGAGFLNYRWL